MPEFRLNSRMSVCEDWECRHLIADGLYCGTFRTPTLMSKRTIRILDEGGWSGVGGA